MIYLEDRLTDSLETDYQQNSSSLLGKLSLKYFMSSLISLETNSKVHSKRNEITNLSENKVGFSRVSHKMPSWEALRGLSWIIIEDRENFI